MRESTIDQADLMFQAAAQIAGNIKNRMNTQVNAG